MAFCFVMVLGTGILCRDPQETPRVIDTACQAFAPIEWSTRDTDQTIIQVREHNAVYDDLCVELPPDPGDAASETVQ